MKKQNFTYSAIVSKVIDGDTLDVTIDLGFRIVTVQRLRLLRLDAPDMKDPDEERRSKAIAAKELIERVVKDKTVTIQTAKSDMFGRYLAEVYVVSDGQQISLNQMLLDQKLVEPFISAKKPKAV